MKINVKKIFIKTLKISSIFLCLAILLVFICSFTLPKVIKLDKFIPKIEKSIQDMSGFQVDIQGVRVKSGWKVYANKLNLKYSTAPILELESGSNDPMSYVLVILVLTLMQGESTSFVFGLFLKQMILGMWSNIAKMILAKTDLSEEEQAKYLEDTSLVPVLKIIAIKSSVDTFLAPYLINLSLGLSDSGISLIK